MNTDLTQQATPPKKNFDFVDTIRCISMIGIVFEHASVFYGFSYINKLDTFVEVSVMQFFKFGTISFFLIGGFLINYKFQEYTPGQYLRNRFKNTIKPWLFWILVFVLLDFLDRYVAYSKGSDDRIVTHFFAYAGDRIVSTLFFTSYWFILNFLICISLLLIFKRYLYSIWFGVILGFISIFYSFNLYHHWIITQHSTALFGFVFYLWLGVYMNRYYDHFKKWIEKTPLISLILAVVVAFLLADWEAAYLLKSGNPDPYNTLRISNIIYSIVAFVLMLKIGNIPSLQKRIDPRNTTFGIYLIHAVVIERVFPLIFVPFHLDPKNFSVWTNIGYSILKFSIAYFVTLFLVKLILKTKMRWSVGGK
ncbi:acyltransferase [Pedobacter sp. ISL-68]|uniref:acyltransferase family protein n=1 Tax=unclassified Pedobacter TaxID=2628915 RepID=UPI001BE90850|nr:MULTISPECIES: acyltransferase [unclassified Pedobacter]MBT2559663.1 acyltransferase [Pedobacter sp. ISL-64]MBT2591968.1 acyltransferase [Pedobacter sp. ISL-68]